MTHYPKQVVPPVEVQKARTDRIRHMTRSMILGVSIRSLVVVSELIGAWIFNSAALLTDGISSIVDISCTLFLVLFTKLAARPPDDDHPFGHGRYEPLAGMQLGVLLAFVGGAMLIQQLSHLHEPHPGIVSPYAWLIPCGALILLEISYIIVMHTAKKHKSPALAADAVHYRVDSLSSLFAMLALFIASYLPNWGPLIDHFGAIAISLLMIILGGNAIRQNFHQLMDRVPSKDYFDLVRKAAHTVLGVRDTEKIRIQIYGPDAHVDVDIEVDPQLSVENAHKISQHVRVAIQKEWPMVRDVTVHVEPFYPNDH